MLKWKIALVMITLFILTFPREVSSDENLRLDFHDFTSTKPKIPNDRFNLSCLQNFQSQPFPALLLDNPQSGENEKKEAQRRLEKFAETKIKEVAQDYIDAERIERIEKLREVNIVGPKTKWWQPELNISFDLKGMDLETLLIEHESPYFEFDLSLKGSIETSGEHCILLEAGIPF